jgi:hypothetical protein
MLFRQRRDTRGNIPRDSTYVCLPDTTAAVSVGALFAAGSSCLRAVKTTRSNSLNTTVWFIVSCSPESDQAADYFTPV